MKVAKGSVWRCIDESSDLCGRLCVVKEINNGPDFNGDGEIALLYANGTKYSGKVRRFSPGITHELYRANIKHAISIHELKIWPEYFDPVLANRKRVEIRANNRDYQVGDTLILREFNPQKSQYTGREVSREITHILKDLPYVPDGFVALSISNSHEAATAGGLRKVLEFYGDRDNWYFKNSSEMRYEEPWKAAAFALSTTAGEFAARRMDALVELYRIVQEIVATATVDNGDKDYEFVSSSLLDDLRMQIREIERLERGEDT